MYLLTSSGGTYGSGANLPICTNIPARPFIRQRTFTTTKPYHKSNQLDVSNMSLVVSTMISQGYSTCEHASQLLVALPTGRHRTSNESPNFCTYDQAIFCGVFTWLDSLPKRIGVVSTGNFSCACWQEPVGGTSPTCGPQSTSGL